MATAPFGRARAVLLLSLVGTLAGCARNPATGERELSLVSEAQEIQMGREADADIVASLGLYGDEALQAYVQDLGMRLAAVSERPDLPWTFRVVDDPTVNAFALPGGFVYITRGIMSHLTSEAELVGILGHEIGHITARHTVSRISRAQLTQLGLGVGMILVPELQQFGGLADLGLQLLFLSYGRDDERESDALGVRYMTRLEYDPRELADVMAMLEATSRLDEGSGRVPQWLSTHPDPANRVQNILELAEGVEGDLSRFAVLRDPYLRRIDGLVFGMDPREGYFRDDLFIHPQLRFRVSFPRGWQHVNMKQAVQSVASEEDAAVILTLAQGSAAEAMQEFGGQQGIQVRNTARRTLNGLPAVTGELAATTEQGVLSGLVAFVEHGGDTYRLLGYAPQGSWSRHAGTIETALGSFAPETDPALLSVEPSRLQLVTLQSRLAFDAFIERYPSTVRPEIVAIINQVQPDGAFPAGVLAKRVVGDG